jgi:hypothetical protein
MTYSSSKEIYVNEGSFYFNYLHQLFSMAGSTTGTEFGN